MAKEKCVCARLRHASRTLTAYYSRMLSPAGVTAGQYSLLSHLARLNAASTSGLAEDMRLDRSTLTRNLKPLFTAGLVEDTAVKGSRDRRLSLTQAGKDTLVHAEILWKRAQRGLKDQLGEKRLKAFLKTLSRLETL